MEKITKFVKFQRPEIVKILPKQNLMVKYDDKDQNQHISIKWHWKKLQNLKIWASKNFEKKIKRAARLFDTPEYSISDTISVKSQQLFFSPLKKFNTSI